MLTKEQLYKLSELDGWEEYCKGEARLTKSLEEWVVIAEVLAKEHGGVLPNQQWLRENGYIGLYASIFRNPEAFKHIKQKKPVTKSLEEWVVIAEVLAKEHGGVLPSMSWLDDNDFSALRSSMRNNPEAYKHIEQEKFVPKSLEEWVVIAEVLAKENDGILPCVARLLERKMSGLVRVMKTNPELFQHIEQENFHNTVSEWVVIAEVLAKEHGGVLPNQQWLRENGYIGLYASIFRNPEAFKHIKQKKPNRVSDWVKVAENLAKEHGGVPHKEWLKKNNYYGLAASIYRNPGKFKHIKQIC